MLEARVDRLLEERRVGGPVAPDQQALGADPPRRSQLEHRYLAVPVAAARGHPRSGSAPSSTIRSDALQRRFPRLQGLACRCARDPRAAARRRPPRSGERGAEVAVVNGCCVTNEAAAKSRKAAARAARTHARVYVTGCAANLAPGASAGLPDERHGRRASAPEETAAFVAGDVGAIGCVQADARLDRVRAFVKIQDGCSFSCGFCVIPLVRGASRSRSAAAVLREIATARRAGPPRGRPDRDQPRLLPRPRRPVSTCRGSCARPGRPRGSSA